MGQKRSCRSAGKDPVQLMASGQCGRAGVPALCPAVEVPGRGGGTALTPHPSMVAMDVRALTCKVPFAMVTHVQRMVTGAPGVPGEHAAGHVTEGRCGATARVTTHVLPTGGELVEGQTPRCRGATPTCVLWMETGDTGTGGASALPLVEEVRRLGDGSATVQRHRKVAVPVQGMPPRYPDAILRRVQVGPSEPEEVLLETLTTLNLALLSLMPR